MKIEHLTDEQFAELLGGGAGDAKAKVHVESCAVCRDELRSLGAAVGDLSFASLRWAERRALRIEAPSQWKLNWSGMPGWGATLAGVLVLGVALGVHLEDRNVQVASVQAPAQAAVAPSDDELAQDNRLMRSIQSELTEQAAQVPIRALSGATRTHHRAIREESN